jgi:hypothetical protein
VIEEDTAHALDFEALRDAIEGREADLLLGFYAEDAELRVVNGGSADGPVFELKGRSQIERYLHAVCDQEVACAVGDVDVEEGRISFIEACEYPDGTKVLVRTTLELRGGRIFRQLDVVERQP